MQLHVEVNEVGSSSFISVYSILAITILLPVSAMLIWCCLAVDEWLMEDDSRGAFRRMLHEAEAARIREEVERKK